MDNGAFHILGAWASLHSHVFARAQQPRGQPQRVFAKAAVEAPPQPAPSKPQPVIHNSKAACMRGCAPIFPPTDASKGTIDWTRCVNKAASNGSSDEAEVRSLQPVKPAKHAYVSTPQLVGTQQGVPPELPTVAEVLRTAKTFLQPTHAVERQFYADCYRACQAMPSAAAAAAAAVSNEGPPQLPYLSSVPEVALRLSCLGHRVVVRRVVDSRQYWSKSMTNTFCYSVLPGTGIGYVLDPGFKEHFRAGCMSDRFRDIWECLPPLFVGPPARLVQLVQMLCAELQASFEAADRQLPPWRTFAATINRWMSPVFRDLPVPQRRSSGGGNGHHRSCTAAAGVAAAAAVMSTPSSACCSSSSSSSSSVQTSPSGSHATSSSGSTSGSNGSASGGGSSSASASGGDSSSSSSSSGGGSGVVGVIPAAEAQAFLRACEELVAGTASAKPKGAAAATGATAASTVTAAAATVPTASQPTFAAATAACAAVATVSTAGASPGPAIPAAPSHVGAPTVSTAVEHMVQCPGPSGLVPARTRGMHVAHVTPQLLVLRQPGLRPLQPPHQLHNHHQDSSHDGARGPHGRNPHEGGGVQAQRGPSGAAGGGGVGAPLAATGQRPRPVPARTFIGFQPLPAKTAGAAAVEGSVTGPAHPFGASGMAWGCMADVKATVPAQAAEDQPADAGSECDSQHWRTEDIGCSNLQQVSSGASCTTRRPVGLLSQSLRPHMPLMLQQP
ncbi:hypothetical protein Agub_g11733 [Astrephomene gubernaculifera]|uniref:Uncharacterized protein n=1 Tax=Astrephomene gubernaculifera TaxID=47775 RepID=A0AAD3DXD3_9CHLO|nr:hypothetical protein Agub_g11733 [Astrephomene gubernaculifera]